MNNDTNNNLNGTVLGSVDNIVNNNPNNNSQIMANESVEVLDNNNSLSTGSLGGGNDLNNTLESGIANQNPNPIHNGVNVNMEAPKEPTPAYTNPQTINPMPMPGFENSGTIGTTPPISLEPEKKPKKKGNKVLFIIIVLILLAGVGFGTYYVLNYTDLLSKPDQISVDTKDLEINLGESLSNKITDYATITGTDSKNCSVDVTKVNINVAGTYEYEVTCGDTVKKGSVKVIDNTELVVETKRVYKTSSDTLEANEFIEGADSNLTYEFVDPESIQGLLKGEFGTYNVKIKVTDKNNKSAEVTGELIVLEYPVKGNLVCNTNPQNISDLNATMTLTNKFAILNTIDNAYSGIASETYTFKFASETEYANLLAKYKSENTITINNVTGNAKFDDTNLTITISNNLDNNKVVSEYGENVMATYITIKNHFESTLGYQCAYEK